MKVLVLANSISGLYSFRKEVIEAFINKKFEVYISCPVENDQHKAEWFKNIGCVIIDTAFNRKGLNPIADIYLMYSYVKQIRQLKPNVVLSYTIKPNLYGGMACSLCRVNQIANITGLGTAVEYSSWLQKLTIFLYKLGLKNTAMVFFQNDENRQFCIKRKMVKGASRLIPGSGVNLNYHRYKEYPSDTEPIKFIFIGRIRREKGINEYLAAAQNIKTKFPDTEFHVVGGCEGEYQEILSSLHENGVIVYHGRQSDVRPFVENTHCTIHPTFYPEGMSNVLLESCAAGRPIITTNRAGCREIVDDGVNGFIVQQENSQDLIKKVENFILLPYAKKKRMGLAGRNKVEREFDRSIVVNAYLEEVKKYC